jgi:hypothetical protein
LFPKKIRLDDNFNNCQFSVVPTIKSLTPNYTPTQIPEPFLEGEIQTYTIEDLWYIYIYTLILLNSNSILVLLKN